MARSARKKDDSGEVKPMDFAMAYRLWKEDIKPAISSSATEMQSISQGYKVIKKTCHIQPQAAKLAFKLKEMEESKRDDFLRGLVGLLKEMGVPLESNDLVDQAERPQPSKPRRNLVVVGSEPPVSDGTETDLADVAAEVTGDTPAPGTSAAAVKAMREDHAKDKAEEDFDGPPPRKAPADD